MNAEIVNNNDHPETLSPVTIYTDKNRVSLSTSYGCNLGCEYCILKSDQIGIPTKVQPLGSADDVIEILGSYRDEISESYFSINDHSDPLLKANQKQTLEVIRSLGMSGYSQPILLTTKTAASRSYYHELADLSNNNLSVFVSFSFSSTDIEPASISARIHSVKRSHMAGIHTVLLLKPVHHSITDLSKVREVFTECKDYVDEIVLSSLKITAPLKEQLLASRLDIPTVDSEELAFDIDFLKALLALSNHYFPQIPISKKRKCAVNRYRKINCKPPGKILSLCKDQTAKHGHHKNDLFDFTVRDVNGYCRLAPDSVLDRSNEELRDLQYFEALLTRVYEHNWFYLEHPSKTSKTIKVGVTDLESITGLLPNLVSDYKRWMTFAGCKSDCGIQHLEPATKGNLTVNAISDSDVLLKGDALCLHLFVRHSQSHHFERIIDF